MNGKILPGDMHEHTHTTIGRLFHGFIHPTLKPRPAVDQALIDSAAGKTAAFRAAAVLVAVAVVEFIVAAFTQSTALVADGLNALAGAAFAIPLFVASAPITEATSKFFTYGRERAEDLLPMLAIVALAVLALGTVVAAAIRLGFLAGSGNAPLVGAGGVLGIAGHAAAAYLLLAAGRSVASRTLAADGRSLIWSGLTGLIVIAAALAIAGGWAWAESLAGLVIAVIVIRNLWRAAQQATTRLIDGIEEDLTWRLARAAEEAGAGTIADVRARWAGHRLHAEITVGLDSATPLAATRAIAGKIRAALAAQFPQVKRVAVLFVPVDAPTTKGQ